jgi:hypothetical protein
VLSDPHLNQSLLTLGHTQLGADIAAKIKSDTSPVPVALPHRNASPIDLAPKHEQIGLVSIRLPAQLQSGKPAVSTVLRFSFPVDQARPVRTTLVL